MRALTILLAVTCGVTIAASQKCALRDLSGAFPEPLSLGSAVATVPVGDQELQDKAPPDSVFVDVQPVIRKKAEPVYPKLAIAAGIEGKVTVRFWVDTKGNVHDVMVVQSDHEVLNQTTIDAARQFEFDPATARGKPVSMWVTVPFKFKIADKTDGADLRSLPVSLQGAIGCITTILSGEDVTKCKSAITPDAYAVIGRRYMPLADAIERRGTAKGLPDERGWELSMVRTVMDDGAELATLLLRTVQKKSGAYRFHTVVCVRTGEGEWKIRHWHAGQ
jgi:TonB family protein